MRYPITKPRGHIHYVGSLDPAGMDDFDEKSLTPRRLSSLPAGGNATINIALLAGYTTDSVVDIESEVLG